MATIVDVAAVVMIIALMCDNVNESKIAWHIAKRSTQEQERVMKWFWLRHHLPYSIVHSVVWVDGDAASVCTRCLTAPSQAHLTRYAAALATPCGRSDNLLLVPLLLLLSLLTLLSSFFPSGRAAQIIMARWFTVLRATTTTTSLTTTKKEMLFIERVICAV